MQGERHQFDPALKALGFNCLKVKWFQSVGLKRRPAALYRGKCSSRSMERAGLRLPTGTNNFEWRPSSFSGGHRTLAHGVSRGAHGGARGVGCELRRRREEGAAYLEMRRVQTRQILRERRGGAWRRLRDQCDGVKKDRWVTPEFDSRRRKT